MHLADFKRMIGAVILAYDRYMELNGWKRSRLYTGEELTKSLNEGDGRPQMDLEPIVIEIVRPLEQDDAD